jgi:hypothetical protein
MEGSIMKIAITGHTKGLGKYLYNQFEKNHEVIGISRSTGYDLETDVDKIADVIKDCDLFINNASYGKSQIELLDKLFDKIPKIVVMGSVAADYDQIIKNEYSRNKKELSERCKQLSLLQSINILFLNISMLEDAVSGDNLIKFEEVYNVIDFWLKNPKINYVNFEFKLTPFTLEKIKEKYNASQESIDFVINNMCDEKRKYF